MSSVTWYRPAMLGPEQHDAHVWLHAAVQTLRLWGWYIDYRMDNQSGQPPLSH